jgi:hypothetical protein
MPRDRLTLNDGVIVIITIIITIMVLEVKKVRSRSQ